MKFMFGLPSATGWFDTHVVSSVLNQLAFIVEGHHGVVNRLVHHTLIHNARNQIVMSAIEQECDYLFFIDSDCVLPVDALKKLVADDKDIVAGMYFGKVEPFPPIIYTKTEKGLYRHMTNYPKDQLVEADAVGMGCCLIKVDALKNFVFDKELEYEGGFKKTVKESYAFEPLPSPDSKFYAMGEDVAFCKRCQDLGYKIYVDTGVQCAHQTVRYIDERYYQAADQRMKAAE
jgi:cellulose synthase/poly-beta-1,6-N-acetylglucosamine synthase-like glycosyltransferase